VFECRDGGRAAKDVEEGQLRSKRREKDGEKVSGKKEERLPNSFCM
jgi:hypothetical protein